MNEIFITEFGQLDTSESILSDATAARQMSIQNAATEGTKQDLINEFGNFLRNFNSNSELIYSDTVTSKDSIVSDMAATPIIAAKDDPLTDPISATHELDESLTVSTSVAKDTLSRKEAINRLEDQFTFSYSHAKINDAQTKYIRSFKSNLHKKFKTYDDLLTFCNDYTDKGGLLDAEEFMAIHTIYTMPHPEMYIDYFTFDLFSEDTMHGGILYFINDFKKSVALQ